MTVMAHHNNLTIAVAGTGYVGLSLAVLLATHNRVLAVDVVPEKVTLINGGNSPIQDEYIEKYLAEKTLDMTATLDGRRAYAEADFVIIAAPTNYDSVRNYFDTSHVEEVIDLVLDVNPDAVIIIKSTIPVGYCRSLYLKYAAKGVKRLNLLFSPAMILTDLNQKPKPSLPTDMTQSLPMYPQKFIDAIFSDATDEKETTYCN